jgi:predicted nucleic acid-binding Zn ribbon protein
MTRKLSEFYTKFEETGPRQRNSSLKKLGSREVFDFIHLIQQWPDIVGSALAQETVPLKNRHGVLTVLTRQPAFSEQVKFMEEPIKHKIVEVFPSLTGKIKRINFFCNPSAFLAQRQQAQHHQGEIKKIAPKLHPQSPQFKSLALEAKSLFDEVEDQEMREALSSLYIQSKS